MSQPSKIEAVSNKIKETVKENTIYATGSGGVEGKCHIQKKVREAENSVVEAKGHVEEIIESVSQAAKDGTGSLTEIVAQKSKNQEQKLNDASQQKEVEVEQRAAETKRMVDSIVDSISDAVKDTVNSFTEATNKPSKD